MDYTKFFAKRVGRRHENLIRYLTDLRSSYPEAIVLAGGMPNPKTFPFKAISVTYGDNSTHNLTGSELDAALQYGPSQGYPPFVAKYRDFQQKWHTPPRQDWDIVCMAGSQDGFCKILDLVLDEGDPIMVQMPAYTATLGAVRSMAPEFIGIQQDGDGIIPEEIEKACEERIRKKQSLPKLLYVNPIGSNPTGAVLTFKRKQQVYKMAQKYDFLIVEDDAYFFLHFLDEQPKSLFSMDTDGRVIRMDSFSKIVSGGIRLGAVTANKEITKKLIIHVENSTLHASSLSQMLVYKIFATWSPEKLDQHLKDVRNFYREKRGVMVAAVEKHLTGLAEWSVPMGGMFVWVKLTTIDNTLDFVMKKLVPNAIFVVPGNAFNYDSSKPDQHLRLSYSFASTEEVDKALSTIAKLIREETAKQKNI